MDSDLTDCCPMIGGVVFRVRCIRQKGSFEVLRALLCRSLM